MNPQRIIEIQEGENNVFYDRNFRMDGDLGWGPRVRVLRFKNLENFRIIISRFKTPKSMKKMVRTISGDDFIATDKTSNFEVQRLLSQKPRN